METIYDIPLEYQKENLDKTVLRKLQLPIEGESNLDKWKTFITRLKNPTSQVRIGLVGKYIELQDAYKSIFESFIHAGVANNCKVIVESIHSEDLTPENVSSHLGHLDGLLVAPGFGSRGIEGKISAIKFVRENNIPFLGICLGMQMAVIEWGRNVLGLADAHSTEMDPDSANAVIAMMEEQKKIVNKGGTMRLGAYKCILKSGSKAFEVYGKTEISERHRHRYEFNNDYLVAYEKSGMIASGKNPDSNLVEIVEIPSHRWFVGVQFHPELKSTVENPHPVFIGLIKAAIEHKQDRVGAKKMQEA
jgi:CTP synthase